ncbi:hypothetical protein BDY21DRAFT_274042, partial [Lineolata rhizophorae]
STSKSSVRYNLDEHDVRKNMLVYSRLPGGSELDIQSQQSLCKSLDSAIDPPLVLSKKKIPRGNSWVEVRQGDLYTDEEREEYSKYPTFMNSLSSISLPRAVYWQRLLLDKFQYLYIVSPRRSPENSPESSQNVSPANSFPRE